MAPYAKGTGVTVSASIDEIRKTVRRFGAGAFQSGESDDAGMIAFEAQGRKVRFRLRLPSRHDRRFTHQKINQFGGESMRKPEAADRVWEQACAESWRALAAVVKAKLVAVEAGIVTFEEEFLAHVIMPSGRTVHEEISQNIALSYQSGESRPLLEGPR